MTSSKQKNSSSSLNGRIKQNARLVDQKTFQITFAPGNTLKNWKISS